LKTNLQALDSATLTNDQSYHNLSHFLELDYLETCTRTRYQLLYKYPLILCLVSSFYFKRVVLRAHADLLSRSFYLRLNTGAKRTHNGLHFGLLVLYVGNFASMIMGSMLSGVQYANGVNNRYFKKIEGETELRRKYLEDMRAY
jgi:hypothetical protein